MPARPTRFGLALAAAALALGCGASNGSLNQTSITCSAGRTLLDGVCVHEAVADYVACVRAQGAQLDGTRQRELSVEAGALGVRAGASGEVRESLEKRYAASDAAMLEIVRRCNAAAGTTLAGPAETARAAAPFAVVTGSIRAGSSRARGPKRATFRAGLQATPAITLLTARGVEAEDTFAWTAIGRGADVQANVWRQDRRGDGWGQDLGLDWLVCGPHASDAVKAGSAIVGSSSAAARRAQIGFPTPFASTPRVLVTAHGVDAPDTFVATTVGVSPSGFAANVVRVDGPEDGWGQELTLDWLAWVGDAPAELAWLHAASGTAACGSRGTDGTQRVRVAFGTSRLTAPVVLVTARGVDASDTFAVTTTSADNAGFGVNVRRVDGANAGRGWGQALELDWLALDPK
jgi:hypothetical protein